MLSTPPATNTSPSPQVIACAAIAIALRPEPQLRCNTEPGISIGKPATSAAWRATQRLSSPAWLAQPTTTSSIFSGEKPLSATTLAITLASISSGRNFASAPACRPNGLRQTGIHIGVERHRRLLIVAVGFDRSDARRGAAVKRDAAVRRPVAYRGQGRASQAGLQSGEGRGTSSIADLTTKTRRARRSISPSCPSCLRGETGMRRQACAGFSGSHAARRRSARTAGRRSRDSPRARRTGSTPCG